MRNFVYVNGSDGHTLINLSLVKHIKLYGEYLVFQYDEETIRVRYDSEERADKRFDEIMDRVEIFHDK